MNKQFNLETIKDLAKEDSPVIPQSLRQLFQEPASIYSQNTIITRFLKHEESNQLMSELRKIKAESEQEKAEYLRVQQKETLAYLKFLKVIFTFSPHYLITMPSPSKTTTDRS